MNFKKTISYFAIVLFAFGSLTASSQEELKSYYSRSDGSYESKASWSDSDHNGPRTGINPGCKITSGSEVLIEDSLITECHKVLIDQEKEGLGFLMVLGCYMEGLNIVLDQAQDHDLILFVHLLNQQKNYGNNLKSVLNGYEIPLEIQQEVKDFNTVLNTLNKIDLPSVYELKSGSKTIVGIKREDITLIKQSVSSFRKSILI